MTMESGLTARQEWLIFSDAVQADVNQILDDTSAEIEAANIILADLYENDGEAAGDYTEEIIEYLDKRWRYRGHQFMISGEWHAPSWASSEEEFAVRHTKATAFSLARSNGFMVKVIEDEAGRQIPRVGMSFITGHRAVSTPTMQSGPIEILAFAEPSEISLQYLRPEHAAVVSGSLEELVETFERLDSIIDLYTNNPDSNFYRQSSKRQQRFLQSIIDSATEALPAPATADKLIFRNAKSKVILATDSSFDGLRYFYPRKAKDTFRFSGEIVGITLPDILEDGYGKHYESPDDLKTARQGIGLVIDPSWITVAYGDMESPTFIVPSRAITKWRLRLE